MFEEISTLVFHSLRFEEINTLVVLLRNNNIIEYVLMVRMPILLVNFFFWFGNPHAGLEIFEFSISITILLHSLFIALSW